MGGVILGKDEYYDGVNSWNGWLNLSGNRITIGSGGINIYDNHTAPSINGGGRITSDSENLNINFRYQVNNNNGFVIHSKIEDHSNHRIGLSITGGVPGFESHIDLTGDEDNTFTGDVHISGNSGLQLYKQKGRIAVRGNIFVNDSGYLLLADSDQISDTSIVKLNGKGGQAALSFSRHYSYSIKEKVHGLVVEGNAVIDFHYRGPLEHGYRHLYLDDLDIAANSNLQVSWWKLGRDHILVRKDSAHLWASLSRIKFDGAPSHWHGTLKDYDKDYWQIIPGLPEPATYGAFLGVVGLGLFAWRRKHRGKAALSG